MKLINLYSIRLEGFTYIDIDGIARWIIPDPIIQDEGHEASKEFLFKGHIASLRSFIEKQVFPTFNWRDNRWANELTIKTIFMCLLRNNNYLMISERQSRSGYAHLAMIVRPGWIFFGPTSFPILRMTIFKPSWM
ncbi:AAA-ATPase-like protein [Candidatus Magnetomorum sp. HK-1]|nr:AAA-ATPase-like protein [Candidatus Magnetomorum sp. HK-1]